MPTPPVIHRFENPIDLGKALAATIADAMAARLPSTPFLLGCPGGRSAATTYQALGAEVARREMDLSRLVIAMMDDYVVPEADGWRQVPADAHYSCRRFAREEIQAALNAGIEPSHRIPDENVWFPDPGDPASYDARIQSAGGIDFFILACGAGDGHVAFNPPGSPVTSRTRIVELARQTRVDNLATFPEFEALEDVPGHGLTVGVATIVENSRAAAMVVTGADKQTAFGRLASSGGYDPQWPATAYRLIPGAALYADSAACGSAGQDATEANPEGP